MTRGKTRGDDDAGLDALETALGHRFASRAHLRLALTHISSVTGAQGSQARVRSYQRLEFLGDHVLGLVVSDMLYRAYPNAEEGELSRRLADLVCEEACAEVARAMDLGPHIRLGPGEDRTGGRERPAILADVAEAVLAAVYLDAGFEAAETMVEKFWRPRLSHPGVRRAIPRPRSRNGRKVAACRRRTIGWSSARDPIIIPNSALPSSCRAIRRSRRPDRRSRWPRRPPLPPFSNE